MVPRVAGGSGSGSWASSPGTRKSMQGNRSRDTKPELAVRSAVHRRGLRFRVSARPQPEPPRTADLVLRKSRIAVFVDGCYWHGCPEHHTQPAANFEYWANKIARNIERDAETTACLQQAGWTVPDGLRLRLRACLLDDPRQERLFGHGGHHELPLGDRVVASQLFLRWRLL